MNINVAPLLSLPSLTVCPAIFDDCNQCPSKHHSSGRIFPLSFDPDKRTDADGPRIVKFPTVRLFSPLFFLRDAYENFGTMQTTLA